MPNARPNNGQRATKRSASRKTNRRQYAPSGHNPGTVTRKSAKPLDHGSRSEEHVISRLASRTHQIDIWRRPGVATRRINDRLYRPDAAGYLPELDALVNECSPDVKDLRPDYNFLGEVKSQKSAGSAKQKIETAIADLGHASDVLGVPAVVILDTPVLSAQEIRCYKAEGTLHSVVVLEESEITRDLLIYELMRVAKERRRLMNRIGTRGGYTPTKNPPIFEQGLAVRIIRRRLAGKVLRHYGAMGSTDL